MTLRAGVIGWPVDHSKGPLLHGHWLRRYGVDAMYERIPVAPDDLPAFFQRLRDGSLRGVNITIPHKVAAMALVDEVSPVGQAIGAINTVVVAADGRLRGDNTDAFGFMAHLRATTPDVRLSPAVVLGAGGAARAVLHALINDGASRIRLLNRSGERARELAERFGPAVSVLSWDDRATALAGAGLLVNTTSLGMKGQPPLDLALDALPADAVVYDIVYVPLVTPLLAQAAARGLRTVDGLGMLLHQARPAFAAWFGRDPEVTPALKAETLGL